MTNKTTKPKTIQVATDPNPKGARKCMGGGIHDDWNDRLSSLVASALPINHENAAALNDAAVAAFSGMIDMKPADPIEGVLIGQIIVSNEAALSMYRRAWQQPPEYFEARIKYLALADKATRTVGILTDRLDQHRNRGQQQIVVKHVTVNAEQALVTDQVLGGAVAAAESDPKRLLAGVDQPMKIVEPALAEALPAGGASK